MLQMELPSWDLTDFYSSPQDPQMTTDLTTLAELCQAFSEAYRGQFQPTQCEGSLLFQAIGAFETIQQLMAKLMSYAYLNYATQVDQSEAQQLFQKVQEAVTVQSTHLIFFELDLNKIEENVLKQAYESSKALGKYQAWLDIQRLYKDHQLSDDLERLMVEKNLTSNAAWVRLYDETLERLRFSLGDSHLTLAEILDKFSHKDPLVRKDAALSLSKGLISRLPEFTLVTNTLAKDKEINDQWRKFSTPVSARNLSNHIEDDVVEALRTAVKEAYSSLAHRYYALKAKWLGLEKLEYWDRNAPLPEAPDQTIPWEEAKDIVHKAYSRFSPEMAEVGKRFFDNQWIDVPPKPGKRSGAFAHPTVPGVHPYLLLNYQGKLRDVMTLAHELGHGVHQVLASEQGFLLSQTPLTIAETASVFGEMLTFQDLLEKASSGAQGSNARQSLIAAKVEDMLNTVVRQIAFFEFESQVHDQRRTGELSSDQLGQIWMRTQAEALGPSVHLDEAITPYWSYVSHFIHAPFYVYSYAFGDCLVNSLYAVYRQGHPGFVSKYMDLLRAGGSKSYVELLHPFGLDARDPQFWSQGLGVIGELIDQLEMEGRGEREG
jgi:oligoendopeptidase F